MTMVFRFSRMPWRRSNLMCTAPRTSAAIASSTAFVTNLRCREGTGLVFYSGRFGDFHDFGHDQVPWLF